MKEITETPTSFSLKSILLFQEDMPKVAKHLFTAKMAMPSQRYDQLDNFRQQIEQSKAGLYHQPYTHNKKSVMRYKLTFYGFSAIFVILGLLSLSLSTTIGCGIFFNLCGVMKSGIFSSCMFLSFCSSLMALAMRTEREAVMQCVRKAKAILKAVYSRKQMRLGIKRFFAFFGPHRKQFLALKHVFEEVSDKINDRKEEAMHLVHRIATSHTLDAEEKEDLLNQAIEELNEKLMTLTHGFRHTSLPYYNSKVA